MFFVQGTAPAFVNATAREAKGGAGALYTTFYYLGATFGSVLPGYRLAGLRAGRGSWRPAWPRFRPGLLAVVVLCA